jgi:DNA primase
VDVEALKEAHPIRDVVASYGVELRRLGRGWAGRCPFHHDQGRPNFFVWPDTRSWWCFRCNLGGDALRFVELAESVGFLEAAERLTEGARAGALTARRAPPPAPVPRAAPVAFDERSPEELAVLRTATSLYHHRLLADSAALVYLERRGVDRTTAEAWRIGYAAGDELVPALRWHGLPLGPALRAGLLDHSGREFLAGRIVVPELRGHQPIWLVGRLLRDPQAPTTEEADEPPPKYLVLRGAKPLLGASTLQGSEAVVVVEGVFDMLTLRQWGYPAVALLGTHARPDVVEQLRMFRSVYVVLDQDDAGLEATLRLEDLLGAAALPVALPDGAKDVAELATRRDGQTVFAAALLQAVGALEPDPTISPNCARPSGDRAEFPTDDAPGSAGH